MALLPIPPDPEAPDGPDSDSGQDDPALDEEACRVLRAFFEVLEEWDARLRRQ